jgi:hypothetical protein
MSSPLVISRRAVPSPAPLPGGRVRTETFPDTLADTKLQLRVRLRGIVGGGAQQLVGSASFAIVQNDCQYWRPSDPVV